MSKKIQKYEALMASATNYEDWKDAAQTLDHLTAKAEWKHTFASDLYNYELIADRLTLLRKLKQENQVEDLYRNLREGLHHDLGNMGNDALYNQCNFGTKDLIEDYIDEVCVCLEYLCDKKIPGRTNADKLDFFRDTLLSYGRPALLLSGGASLGLFHIGVVKALWEQNLLPQVIAGSSAGSIVAAALGTHTNEELPQFFDPNRANIDSWKWMGFLSGFKGKGFMDQKQLQDYIRSYVGELTMEEAYEKTGRSINITVSPTEHNQRPRLLSGYTSPYMLLWSASLASCAVPGLFPPVKLMKKDKSGHNVPYMPRLRWVDGAVVSDLPIERLMHLYDVNYTIVSQTNPHVVPFLGERDSTVTDSLLSLPKNMLKSELKFHGKGLFNYLRNQVDSEILKQVFGHAYAVLNQQYYGDVTISPRYKWHHYLKILSNPTPQFMQELMLEGERVTWPKMSMIRTHAKISQTLETCVAKLKKDIRSRKASLSVIA